MDPELRDIMFYYYDHRFSIQPQETDVMMRIIDDKDGLWIKKDNNVLAILPSGKLEWNGRPLTTYNPNVIAVFQEFVNSIHLQHQKDFQVDMKEKYSLKQPQEKTRKQEELLKHEDYSDVLQQQQQKLRKQDELSIPEHYLNVIQQKEKPILQELLSHVRERNSLSGYLWDIVFSSIRKDTHVTPEEEKIFFKIFKEMSESREQSLLFLKSLSRSMRKHPVATRRFLKKILPPGYFSSTVHKHRNWFMDYLRYWMTNISPKEFERQLSQYVNVPSSHYTKAQSFSDVSSIVNKLNKKLYEEHDNQETMEDFYIHLYKLIDPLQNAAHYRYAADIIHEDMINEVMRITRPEDCKGNVLEVMQYMRPGKFMTKHDFVRLYKALLDMNGCNSQGTLFSIAKYLFVGQMKRKCREKHVPMVSTEKIFRVLGNFETPMKTLAQLTPYYPHIRKIFKIMGWIK